MRYSIKNDDGTVSITTLVPIKIIGDGKETIILGVKRTNGQCILYGERQEIAVGDENFDIGDLKEDSINGYTIVFPNLQEEIDKWHPTYKERVLSTRTIEKSEVPTDRYFRDAWEDNGVVEVNMEKAKEIQRNYLRKEREPLLKELDIQYTKSLETKDNQLQDEIVRQKQVLRDITEDPRIANAQSPEELKALTLDALTDK